MGNATSFNLANKENGVVIKSVEHINKQSTYDVIAISEHNQPFNLGETLKSNIQFNIYISCKVTNINIIIFIRR